MKDLIKIRALIIGILGSITLFIVYLGILTWANSFEHAIEQYKNMWYWFTLLIVGFGTQIGLFSYIRSAVKIKTGAATAELATTGGVTTGSMIACCAHHVADILPALGFSAAAVYFVQYQVPFILIGVFSNLIGIIMMLHIIQRLNLYLYDGPYGKLFQIDMIKIRNIVLIISLVILVVSFIIAS